MRSGVEDSKKTYPRIGRVRDSRQERLRRRTNWKGTRSILIMIEGILFEMLSSKEFVTLYNRATRCARRALHGSIKVRRYTYIDIKYIYFPGQWLSGFSNRRSNQRRLSKGKLAALLTLRHESLRHDIPMKLNIVRESRAPAVCKLDYSTTWT